MSTLAEIEKMTFAERFQAMELLWDSLVRDASDIASPDWHRGVVTGRLEKISRGEGVFLSLDEVKRRLAEE